MRINLFYPAVVVIGVALFFLMQPPGQETLSFYGFAESNETAINYNYPVVINEILVRPGELVRPGQALLEVSRRKSREVLADQDFRIQEIRGEERMFRQRKEDELSQLRSKMTDRLAELDRQIAVAERDLVQSRKLLEGLQSIKPSPESLAAQERRVADLKEKRARAQVQGELEISSVLNELELAPVTYQSKIGRLRAEAIFDSSQQIIPFTVTAPSEGLIGSLHVKEDEHVPSYETLITFYEPHSSIVSGYIHEDQTPRVHLDDSFEVYSLKDGSMAYPARVIGLGSRIVSIPSRLRDFPDFETYGREVILEIPADNRFLQKEKVGIRVSPGRNFVK